MQKINRNELAKSAVAGGCCKSSTAKTTQTTQTTQTTLNSAAPVKSRAPNVDRAGTAPLARSRHTNERQHEAVGRRVELADFPAQPDRECEAQRTGRVDCAYAAFCNEASVRRFLWRVCGLFDARTRWKGVCRYEIGRDVLDLPLRNPGRVAAGRFRERLIDQRIISAALSRQPSMVSTSAH